MPYGRIDVTNGILAGKVFIIGPGESKTIGRLPTNDIGIPEPAVSSRHCRILSHPEGFLLEDVGSRNGTLLNGERVESQILDHGDVIKFGRTELVFRVFPSQEKAVAAIPLDSVPPVNDGVQTQVPDEPPVGAAIDRTARAPVEPVAPVDLNLFGRIALYNKMITELQLSLALQEMAEKPGKRLGEILVERGFMKAQDLEIVLRIQNGAKQNQASDERNVTRIKNLLEVATKKGFVKPEQLRHAVKLKDKAKLEGFDVSLEEILLKKKYLKREHYQEILSQQGEQGLGVNIPGYDGYELLGYGGMGAVYKARQISMDRPVAIKVLAERLRDKEKHRERFLREARTVAKLNHENIIAGYDFGEAGKVSFFVMEYVLGKTCEELLQEKHRLGDKEAAEIVLQVARALQHAHEKGMIHRDIKPENVMITDEDRKVKLCDLGLAWNTSDLDDGGKGFGTPNYMSPEQIRGQTVDIRTDIYSLGVTFYRLLFGKLPFYGNSAAVTMSQHLTQPLRFPDETMSPIQRSMSAIIARMMAKEPSDRFQDPAQLAREIESALEKATAPAVGPAPTPAAAQAMADDDQGSGRRRRPMGRRRRRFR